ncbi:MAG: OmpA family protein [Prevotella sp.]|nr:OmpA family protein [Prevotella sp.]
MKIKSILAAALFALTATAANAQATYTDKEGNEYQFQKHAFLQLQGGAQHTVGEAKFSDLISPNVQVGLGYQFNPWFAARLAANAWQSKGGYNGVDVGSGPANATFKYKYVAPGIDLMFNLSNALCGWNPKRVLNVTAFLGGAANISWGNDEANSLYNKGYKMEYIWQGTKVRPVGRAGLGIDFRLSDAVSLGIEGNANITTDKYNSKKAGNPDWYFNALAGLKINLGKTYKKIEKPAPVVEEPAPAPAPAPVVEEVVVEEVVKIEPLRRDIFFKINKSIISDEQMQKVKDIADYLNKYPEAKVSITGYADAGTGNNTINDRLAAQRADSVVKALVQNYGIDRDRIVSDSKGSRIQPFADNDMNRVSICIAE